MKPRGIIKFVADEATGIQKKNSKKLKKVVDKDRVVVIILLSCRETTKNIDN